jgi:lipid-A-disaccharide synthase
MPSKKRPTTNDQRPTILITAGEPSGDILGAELMRELHKQRRGLRFYGVGGAAMRKAGLKSLGDIGVFPGMGLSFLSALPGIFRLLKTLTRWAEAHRPALCLTIDNQEFSARLNKRVSRLGVPCVQYAAPKVWAWRQGRVKGLKKILKHVLCLFPFEADFFNRHGLPATFIGHPVIQRLIPFQHPNIPTSQHPALALLPGSRKAELAYHWPLFLETFAALRRQMPNLRGTVALMDQAALKRCQRVGWCPGLTAVLGEARFQALAQCTAALTKSGTNNLELALLGVPAVVAYRMHPLTYALAKCLVKVRYVSPPNLVAGAEVYPEFIQQAATVSALAARLSPLLRPSVARRTTVDRLRVVRRALATTTPPAAAAARVVLRYLRARP